MYYYILKNYTFSFIRLSTIIIIYVVLKYVCSLNSKFLSEIGFLGLGCTLSRVSRHYLVHVGVVLLYYTIEILNLFDNSINKLFGKSCISVYINAMFR